MRKEIKLIWYANTYRHDVRTSLMDGVTTLEYRGDKVALAAAKRMRETVKWLDDHIMPHGDRQEKFRHIWKDYGDLGLMYCEICKMLVTGEDLDIADSLGQPCFTILMAELTKRLHEERKDNLNGKVLS